MQIGNNFPEIDVKNWANLLENATQSQKQGHKYIVLLNKNLGTSKTIKEKLSIQEIVTISKNKIEEATRDYDSNKINKSELTKLTDNITANTKKLIEARESKWNQPFKKIARGVALIASLVSVIGIPLYFKIREANKKFEDEIRQWKEDIKSAKDEAVLTTIKEKLGCSHEDAKNISHAARQIPKLIKDKLSTETYKENVSAVIHGTFLDKLSPLKMSPLKSGERLEIFNNDFIRQQTFQYDDKIYPDPKLNLKGEARADESGEAIKAMLQTERDKQWEPILQLAVTQTSTNGAFYIPKGDLTLLGSRISWKRQGQSFALLPEFSEQTKPTKLDIVRNPITQNIEKVYVTVIGSIDMVGKNTGPSAHNEKGESIEKSIQVYPEAIKAELIYEITLDNEGNPAINILQCQYSTSITS